MKEVILKIDEVNRNGRMYTKECADHIVESVNSKKPICGTLGFPDYADNIYDQLSVDYKDVAFMVEHAVVDNQSVFGDIKVLDTPNGKLLKGLLENDCKLCFRTRGIGNVKTNEDGVNVVTDYKLLSVAAIPEDQDAFGEIENG